MPTPKFSLNKSALNLVNELINDPDKFGVSVETLDSGGMLIDTGVSARGGFRAGVMVTEICLAGYGNASITPVQYGDLVFPSVFVTTDYPALSALGSQFAGWQINGKDYSALASGPARALSLKPKDVYVRLQYKEESEVAVLALETERKPPDDVIQEVANMCGVLAKNLYIVMFSANSLTGVTQASGRIVETGLHKLWRVGLDPLVVKHAWGYAPIMPLQLNLTEAAGKSSDAILFGGVADFMVVHDDDEKLRIMVGQASASGSKMFQEAKKLSEQNWRFQEVFKETGVEAHQVDANTFAPAVVMVNNLRTGKSFSSGNLDIEAIRQSFGIA